MKNKIFIFLSILCISCSLQAAPVHLKKIQIVSLNKSTELQFDFSARPHQNLMVLKDPERIILDFENTILKAKLPSVSSSSFYLKKISTVKQKTFNVRLVLDLKQAITYKTNLKKIGKQEYRYTVILSSAHGEIPVSAKPQIEEVAVESPELESAVSPILKAKAEKLQDLVVVLDPGHGGKDPGAKGRRGTQEKQVVLAIATYLQKELQTVPGLKIYMTRTSDVFIPLRERLSIARQHKADLFIALHADAFKNSSARGVSVFALSERGATSEGALWLAEKENESEMLGGTDLSDKGQMLKSVLLDMSQTATINSSLLLGQHILDRFRVFTPLHSRKVEQAAFVVLKSPDIPSLLIENGFISNLDEEKNLNSSDYQQKLAKEIRMGVVNYFIENAPVDSVFYQNYQLKK
jgi:N-acetylmuramoyl-L-alanine amidase